MFSLMWIITDFVWINVLSIQIDVDHFYFDRSSTVCTIVISHNKLSLTGNCLIKWFKHFYVCTIKGPWLSLYIQRRPNAYIILRYTYDFSLLSNYTVIFIFKQLFYVSVLILVEYCTVCCSDSDFSYINKE